MAGADELTDRLARVVGQAAFQTGAGPTSCTEVEAHRRADSGSPFAYAQGIDPDPGDLARLVDGLTPLLADYTDEETGRIGNGLRDRGATRQVAGRGGSPNHAETRRRTAHWRARRGTPATARTGLDSRCGRGRNAQAAGHHNRDLIGAAAGRRSSSRRQAGRYNGCGGIRVRRGTRD